MINRRDANENLVLNGIQDFACVESAYFKNPIKKCWLTSGHITWRYYVTY